MRNPLIIVLGMLVTTGALAAEARLEKLWETEAVLQVPESVLYDAERQVLYTSNITGEPWAADGEGSIGKVGLDGKVIEANWVTGLDCPKGMGMIGNRLYVADLDDVVTIDIEKGEVIDRVAVPGAEKINDLGVGEDGTIYVTDSGLMKIHKWVNGVFTTVVEDLEGVNGVHQSGGELLFAGAEKLFIMNDDGTYRQIADGLEGHVDGVERVTEDSWLVSCWRGTVYYVTRAGDVTLLLDGRPTETSAADLGYDPVNKIAYFPGFFKNIVAAYQLHVE